MKSLVKWALASTALISSNAMADTTLCTVNDTSGSPLHVRATAPNGRVIGTYWNGAKVKVLEIQSFESFGQAKPWARLGNNSGGEVGWVYFPYLICPPSALPKTIQATAPTPPTLPTVTTPINSNSRNFDKIFSFPMYDNVVGITFLGGLPKDEKTSEDFKKVVVSNLRNGKLVGSVFTFSPGGNLYEAQQIGRQIRTLRARTWAPWIATDGKTRICQLNPKITDEGQMVDGSFGRLTYIEETREGDSRCECASACFSMWAGGIGRSGGVVGVHRFGHYEYKDKFAWFSTEEARKYYESLEKEEPAWFRSMNVPDNIIQLFVITPFYKMRYLTTDEIAQMNNFPPFLQELVHARCGPEPGPQADRSEKVKSRACLKEIVKEEYKIGAKEYLLAYGN